MPGTPPKRSWPVVLITKWLTLLILKPQSHAKLTRACTSSEAAEQWNHLQLSATRTTSSIYLYQTEAIILRSIEWFRSQIERPNTRLKNCHSLWLGTYVMIRNRLLNKYRLYNYLKIAHNCNKIDSVPIGKNYCALEKLMGILAKTSVSKLQNTSTTQHLMSHEVRWLRCCWQSKTQIVRH